MSVEAVKSYVVELYVTAAGPDGLADAAEQARVAAEQLTREGVPVRYVRSILIPGDETCFLVFEGPSAQAVGEASRRAALDYDRVVEALQ